MCSFFSPEKCAVPQTSPHPPHVIRPLFDRFGPRAVRTAVASVRACNKRREALAFVQGSQLEPPQYPHLQQIQTVVVVLVESPSLESNLPKPDAMCVWLSAWIAVGEPRRSRSSSATAAVEAPAARRTGDGCSRRRCVEIEG